MQWSPKQDAHRTVSGLQAQYVRTCCWHSRHLYFFLLGLGGRESSLQFEYFSSVIRGWVPSPVAGAGGAGTSPISCSASLTPELSLAQRLQSLAALNVSSADLVCVSPTSAFVRLPGVCRSTPATANRSTAF